MRNTFVLDNTLANKTLTKLSKICYAKVRMKRIENLLNQEIENNHRVMIKDKGT